MSATDTPELINRRYRLDSLLGKGGMGTVHKAVDRLTGKTVALKQVIAFAEERGFDVMEIRLALAQEFKVLASLRHPNIISVLDYGFNENNLPFVAMELLENAQELIDAAQGKTQADQVKLLVEVLQALAYLHRRGILHRDLKPGNVLVTADNEVKVLDFGLAAEPEHAKEVAGTLAYMAPEVILGDPPSSAADLYAVGVMAYEIFVGKHPFEADSPSQLINEILMSPPDLSMFDEVPAMQAALGMLLAKSADSRYYNAYEVIEALCYAADIVPPEESQAIRESFLQAASFVGRETELEQLEAALVAASDGKGSAWLVGGESGVGKSRLLDELRVKALVQGIPVLRGQADAQRGLPYQVWRDPLRSLTLTTELNDLDAGILKDILPDIENLIDRQVLKPIELEGEDFHKRLAGTIINVFRQQPVPVVLMVEDLQWTDESLDVLKTLVSIVRDLPLLIVGSFKSEESPNLPEQLPDMQLMKLDRLAPHSVAQLSRSMLGETGQNEELLNLLQRETEGNVYFLVEVMRELAEEAGRLGEIATMTLPKKVLAGGVQNVIRRRLARLPEGEQPLLNAAALVGRELDMAVLNVLKGDIDLDEWLTSCANYTILEVQEGDWYFAHDKLREVVVLDIPENDRVKLHQQVAEAIETVHPDDPEQAQQLAYHWGGAGNIDKEYIYALQAGNIALKISSFKEAINHFQRILEITPQIANLDKEQKTTLQIDLHSKIGESLQHTGRYAEAIEEIEKSLELCRADDNKGCVARSLNLLGDTYWRTSDYEQAKKLCEESLSLARSIDDQHQIAKALKRLGVIALDQGEYDTAQERLEESLAIARKTKDHENIIGVTNNLGIVAVFQGKYEDATRYYEESLALARESGERRHIALTLMNLGTVAGEQGDLDSAVNYFEECLTIARTIGDQVTASLALSNLGFAAQLTENFDQAFFYYDESLAISRSIGNQQASIDALVNLGHLSQSQGDHAYALEVFCDALQLAHEISAMPQVVALLIAIAEITSHKDRAPQWLYFAVNHDAATNYYRQSGMELLDKFKAEMDDTSYTAAVQAGKTLEINACVDEVLKLHRDAFD